MTARDFYNKEEKYSIFSKLTSTGISDDLDKITEFAEDYHQTKLNLLGIANVSNQRELLCAFFKHFRDNGEANIGMTIEQFVDAFLNTHC